MRRPAARPEAAPPTPRFRVVADTSADGADPMAVLRDLAEITHWVSVIKITPEAADDPTTPVIDVRNPEEYAAGRVPGAVLIPKGEFLGYEAMAAPARILAMVASGRRRREAVAGDEV